VPQRTESPPFFRYIVKQYPNVRMTEGGWKRKFYDNRWFSDPNHLNTEGAERFTREVYAEFVDAFSYR
jgi:hypothetical protein